MAQKNDQETAVWVNPGGTASFSYGGGGLTGIGAVYAMANPKGPGGQVMTTSQGLKGTNEAGGSTTSGSMSEPVPASAHVPPDASNLIHENLGSGSHPPSVPFPRCGSHPPVAVSDGAWTYRLAPIMSPRTVWNGYRHRPTRPRDAAGHSVGVITSGQQSAGRHEKPEPGHARAGTWHLVPGTDFRPDQWLALIRRTRS
jgi:hypothetical protein